MTTAPDADQKPYDGHGQRTQRDSMHVIATANPNDLATAITHWKDVATKAETLETQVRDRLATLITPGGWEGSGAEMYKQAVTDEVLERLLKIKASALAMATELEKVQAPAEQAVTAAEENPIPWDAETKWKVEQKKLGFFNWLGDQAGVVLGINDNATLQSYNDAQAGQDYQVLTGSGQVRQSLSKPAWQATQAQSKPMAEVYHGSVSPAVNQFDVWMEHLGLNAAQHKAVSTAADKVEQGLVGFLAKPSAATDPQHEGTIRSHSLGTGGSDDAPKAAAQPLAAPTIDPSRYGSEGYTPPGTSAAGTTTPTAGAAAGALAAPGAAAAAGAALPGVVGATSPGVFTTPPTTAPPPVGMPGTGAAQAPTVGAIPGTSTSGGLGVPPVAGVPAGGIGGVGAAGVRMGMGGFGGMGGMGGMGGAGGLGGAGGRGLRLPSGGLASAGVRGSTNPSFQMGATGRGTVSKGLVGGVESNRPYSSISEAQRGGAPMAPMMGGRGAHKKEEKSEGTGEETWLEEDKDVWGTGKPEVDGLSTS